MDDILSRWKQRLQDASLSVELPADHARSGQQGYRQAFHSLSFTDELVETIRFVSHEQGVPPSTFFLAALTTLLYRYTGQEDIVVGSSVGNTVAQQARRDIHSFINTLFLRTKLSGQPGFRELLTRVNQSVADALEYQDLPYEDMLRLLEHEFSLSDVHLPKVMFVFQNKDAQSAAETAFQMDWGDRTEYADLILWIDEGPGGIEGCIEYNALLFEPDTVSRMSGHFETLLAAAARQPDHSIATLPMLTPEERHQILEEFNNKKAPYPQNATLVQLFEEQVRKTPDAVALIYQNSRLTYEQFNRRANQLAYELQALGVGPDICVGVCLERSADLIVSILGILKAGGAYLPLDPDYPEDRLRFMLTDASAAVLITRRTIFKAEPGQQTRVIYLDEEQSRMQEAPDGNPLSSSRADSLAYVIYTSGSTGQPKGVCCVHRGVINLLTDFENRRPVTPGGVCSWWTSIGFDVSVYEIFSALLFGRALLIVPGDVRLDSRRFFECLRENDVRSAYITPSQLEDLADWLQGSGSLNLERLLVGVEPIQETLLARIALSMPSVKIINGYGPTEATVCTTLFDVDPLDAQHRNTPIGRPVQNTEIYLLDTQGQPVPIGLPGELFIGGDGLARGYLNQPGLTSQKFVPNPFSSDPEARLYRTGDLARYLPDGNIMFIGRMDGQVKLHGYRIELGEIEACLRQHPAVKEALVLVHEFSPGDKRLIAHIVLRNAEKPETNEWRSFLGKTLPVYMIPSAFITIEKFPLTPNGKVDRKALPIPGLDRSELDMQYAAPRNATEETIARIWARIFNLEKVGIHDNFFDLGGDSILSIQITSKTNEAGIYLAPHQVFDHPTIAELAGIAETIPDIQAEQNLVTGELPLSPVQHWFFENNFPELHHWNQSFLIKVQDPLDPSLLEKALQHLLVHHDVLRLRFTKSEDGWHQVLGHEIETVSFSQIDLTTASEADQKARILSGTAELQAGLNLMEGPLLRAALFITGPAGQGYLFMTIHHLVVDGVSWRILLDHLDQLYQQVSHGEPARLPSKTTSYKQWTQRLAEYAQSDSLKQELSYWMKRRDLPFLHLPVDDLPGRNSNTEGSARTVSMSLSLEETENLLREVPKAYQTQINDVLLTALVQVFYRWTGKPTLLINLEGHGREPIFNDVDLLRTVGWFTTIFPVPLSLEGLSEPGEMLKSIKEQLRRIPNRGIGYGLLRYLHTDPEITSQLRSLPEAEISFNYLGQFDQIASSRFKLTNEPCGPERSLQAHRHHLIDVTGMIIDGRLQMDWRYSESVHRRATVENLAQGFMDALKALIAHCQSPDASGYTPSDFPEAHLNQQELDDLLNEIRALESED